MAYLLAALFGGFFLFNSFATPKKAARAVESSLRKLFPGAQVRADIQGKRGRDVLRGRFRSARLEMSRFSITEGTGLGLQVVPSAKNEGRIGRFEVALRDFGFQNFRVAALDLSLDNVALDWAALRKNSQLKLVAAPSVGSESRPQTQGRVRLAIGQEALGNFVRTKYPDLGNVRVALASNANIRVLGQRAFLGASVPFELSGRLALRDGRVLELTSPSVSAGGIPLAPALAAPLTRGLSNLYEIDPQNQWPLAVRATGLKVENFGGAPTLILEADVALKAAR